jgi:hypothetical protein
LALAGPQGRLAAALAQPLAAIHQYLDPEGSLQQSHQLAADMAEVLAQLLAVLAVLVAVVLMVQQAVRHLPHLQDRAMLVALGQRALQTMAAAVAADLRPAPALAARRQRALLPQAEMVIMARRLLFLGRL